jgi:hypothetical protein
MMNQLRSAWWWHVSRRFNMDALRWKLAWLLPRSIALLAFVRVSASTGEAPGPEYHAAYKAFEKGAGR